MANGHDKRDQILTAAERVFDAFGYAATTMDAVAAEAQLSKGSLYNYFQNKEDLFRQVFAATTSSIQDRSRNLLSGSGPAATRLDGLLDLWFERLDVSKRFGRLVLEFWATAARQDQGALSQQFRELYGYWREQLRQLIEQGVAEGAFSQQMDPAAAASLILAVLDGCQVQLMLDVGLVVNTELLDSLKRAVMAGLVVGRSDSGVNPPRGGSVKEASA